MLSSDKNSISNLVSIFSTLNKMKDEPRGVSSQSTVIKDDDDRESTTLSSTEIERIKKLADIFGKALKIGTYATKSESRKIQDISSDKQKALGLSAISDRVTPIQLKQQKVVGASDRVTPIQLKQQKVVGASAVDSEIKSRLESTEVERYKKISDIFGKNISDIFGKALKIGAYATKSEPRKIQDIPSNKQKALGLSAISDRVTPIQLKQQKPLNASINIASTQADKQKVVNASAVDGKIKSRLESTEVERYKQIATIFGQTLKIGIFAPQPEAQKLQDLTPEKDKGKDTNSLIRDKETSKESADSSNSLVDMLLGALGFGTLRSLIISSSKRLIRNIARGIGKGLSKGFTKIKDVIKNSKIFKSLTGVITNISKSLQNKWGSIVNSSKNAFNGVIKNIGKVKDGTLSALKQVPGVVSSVSKSIAAGTSAAMKSAKGLVGDVKGKISSTSSKAIKAASSTLQSARSNVSNFFAKSKDVVGKATKTASVVLKGAAKTTGSALTSAAKTTGSVIKSTGKAISEGAQKLIKQGKSKIGPFVGKLFKGNAGKIGKFLKRIPIVAPVITSLFAAADIMDAKKAYKKKEITLDELNQRAGKTVITNITALGGAALGAAALSFIPGIGTLVGGVAGAFLGEYLGGLLVDKLITPDITKKLGSFVTGTTELQDFFVKDKKVFPFNNKDEILGIKTGGAIDNLLNSIKSPFTSQPDSVMVDSIISFNKFNKTALIEQIKRQDKMIELLTQLIRKPTGGSVTNNSNSNNTQPSNFRDAFSAQTLVTNE